MGFISLSCFILLRVVLFLSLFFEYAKLGFIESGDDSAQVASKLLNGKKENSWLNGNHMWSVSRFALIRI